MSVQPLVLPDFDAATELRPVETVELEGRTIRQVCVPLVLEASEYEAAGRICQLIAEAATGALARTIEHRTQLAREYAEHRSILGATDSVAMPAWLRLDLGWSADGEMRVLELNSACPGGWHLNTAASNELQMHNPSMLDGLRSASVPAGRFVERLRAELGDRIAIVNLSGDYGFELAEFQSDARSRGIEVIICDPVTEGLEPLRTFEPTGVYWKSDPLRVPEAATVVRSIRAISPKMLAEPNWFTVGEDKRLLADLPAAAGAAATHVIDGNVSDRFLRDRHDYVLKPSNLTRGAGIIRGRDCDSTQWEQHLHQAAARPGSHVLQEACEMRHLELGGATYFGDLSAYAIDGVLVGFMGRVSLEPIVNIGRNGFLQTVWTRA